MKLVDIGLGLLYISEPFLHPRRPVHFLESELGQDSFIMLLLLPPALHVALFELNVTLRKVVSERRPSFTANEKSGFGTRVSHITSACATRRLTRACGLVPAWQLHLLDVFHLDD